MENHKTNALIEEEYPPISDKRSNHASTKLWVTGLLLFIILLVGAYFRFVGIDWDENQHLHPDERFMTMVTASLDSENLFDQYFNTAESGMNPHNRGFAFYVYGTLPLFLVNFLAGVAGKTGYGEIHLVGRVLSGVFDLAVVILVFLISYRLYKKRGLALLAAAFSACAVLQIQLSHYYTVDTFANFFVTLAVYFSVLILTGNRVEYAEDTAAEESGSVDQGAEIDVSEEKPPQNSRYAILNKRWDTVIPYILFGLASGMAVASKVSAAPVVLLLPLAVLVVYFSVAVDNRRVGELVVIRNLFFAGIAAFITYRICQPYAFSGPGIFGIKLNPAWVANLKELSGQSSGAVDIPSALQWARRPLWFGVSNLVQWGLGLPLGILSGIGFLWMGWRIFAKAEWKSHILIWAWTALILIWQSLSHTSSMRYFLFIYPALAIIASWAIFMFRDARAKQDDISEKKVHWKNVTALLVGGIVLVGTGLWAYSFSQIYARPVTRVEASRWIYQNIPGAINFNISNDEGIFSQSIAFEYGFIADGAEGLSIAFRPEKDSFLTELNFPHIVDYQKAQGEKILFATVYDLENGDMQLSSGMIVSDFLAEADARGKSYKLLLEQPVELKEGKWYQLNFRTVQGEAQLDISGIIMLGLVNQGEVFQQPLPEIVQTLRSSDPVFSSSFTAIKGGVLEEVYFPRVVDWEVSPGEKTVQFTISGDTPEGNITVSGEMTSDFLPSDDPRGEQHKLKLDKPITIQAENVYQIRMELVEGDGSIAFYGNKLASESSWDDGLPLRLDGYDPYDYSNGIYQGDLNFEMYWEDNESKRDRFVDILNKTDYVIISSSRQWGSIVRLPERYPMTTLYYRNLIGCPDDKDLLWCYRVAEPGMFDGSLGFKLVEVFDSSPEFFGIKFNTQFAEEAFTVYDHPKVFIFEKQSDYDVDQVVALLDSVDLSKVVHVVPGEAQSHPLDLLLPAVRLAGQRAGGTWSDLFNREAFFNRYPILGLVIWYLFFTLLGFTSYPFVRIALGGLSDRGFPFVRLVGMLLLAYVVWLVGSLGVPVTRATIAVVFLGLIVGNLILFMLQKQAILDEFCRRRKYYLVIEGLILAFFVLFLLIRIGNPDLWHPAKGGEKPMDFSYLNAVIKSTTFPPYDPWFEGGYINYYYFGFVLIGMPIKLLGIIPSIGYNLVLPSLFSFLAIGAFSVVWNVIARSSREGNDNIENNHEGDYFAQNFRLLYAGLAGAIGSLILGNWGTVRMIWQGFQRLVAPGGVIDEANFVQSWSWAIRGLFKVFGGARLPYGYGDWYWIPSRVIPEEPITEFPFFTFLYADPHAHMIALPVTVLAISWILSMVCRRWDWQDDQGRYGALHFIITFFLGGVVIGSLRPINTWDLPTYLVLGVIVVLYAGIRYGEGKLFGAQLENGPIAGRSTIMALLSALVLVILSFVLYQPFAYWYGQGYSSIGIWKGSHTPVGSYLTHWIVFLFMIVSWLFYETIDWMAKTPVSALKKLRGKLEVIVVILIVFIAIMVGLLLVGVKIAWLTFPIAAWAGVLILRPGQTDIKRLILFMIGTGLVLTLAVELVVLKGDIGRMNTVFKFYLQAWILLSISAAASFIWLYPVVSNSKFVKVRAVWQFAVVMFVGGALLFPILGSMDKIRDRMTKDAPHGLDGMTYMAYAQYSDQGQDMDLSQDYRAIRWMQDNVQGSPVILEANTPEYRWGSRITINTGLPGVVGWNWHQRQQRAVVPSNWVTDRVDAIGQFYLTIDRQETEDFLAEHDIEYIVVGQLEKAYYPGVGLAKFIDWEGDLWQKVYQDQDTSIYQVKK